MFGASQVSVKQSMSADFRGISHLVFSRGMVYVCSGGLNTAQKILLQSQHFAPRPSSFFTRLKATYLKDTFKSEY